MVALAGCVPNTKIIKNPRYLGGEFDSPEGDWEFVNKWCANSDNMRENDVSISRINTSCRQRKEWGSFPRMPSFTGGAVFGPILNKSTVE